MRGDTMKAIRLVLAATFSNPMAASMKVLLEAVDADKARLDAARPLPPYSLASLREQLTLEWTYHSNAIEGNTLMLRETKSIRLWTEMAALEVLLLNFELMKSGYPPAVIRKEDRLAYYDVLDEACVSGDFSRNAFGRRGGSAIAGHLPRRTWAKSAEPA